MSWMKRAPGSAPPPAAEQPPLGAPQSYGNQQNMYSNYQSTSTGNQNPQQQYWQMQQQQSQALYNQQHGQVYQQQGYGNNANQYYQQPIQYNQNLPNQNFSNTQQGYPQNYFPNQTVPPQNYAQNKVNSDAWEDNWDWGWEDSSKQKSIANQAAPHLNVSQTLVSNNANIIEESFVATNTWNWAMEDKNKVQEQSKHPSVTQQNDSNLLQPPVKTAAATSDVSPKNNTDNQTTSSSLKSEAIKTLNDKDIVKEQLPNLALGKRFHLENLTPQWSIESQMSQESSDGPQNHSEGTYRSENLSRNSSKSSPGFNVDNSNFNYSQSHIEEMYPQSAEWSKISNEDSTVIESHKSGSSRRESHDELSSSMHDMSISNAENVISDGARTDNEYEQNLLESLPPPSVSTPEFVKPVCSSLSTASVSSQLLPPPDTTATVSSLTGQSTSALPPANMPPPSSSQNPFKHAGPFSHKTISKTHSNISSQPFPHQIANSNLTSPIVNKISQHNRMPVGFGANLETTPDNSERPDLPQTANFRPIPVSQQIPDNLEVAPQNDRNEYLQTEHLSSVDYGENTDFSRTVPPPGLRRMVVGQQETEYSQNLNISGDEPPPGLARMVPGQQTESDNYNQSSDNYMDRHVDGQLTDNTVRPFRQADGQQTPDYTQPPSSRSSDRRPIGLDRMVPGEPSNNEYMQYQGTNYGGSNEPRVVTGVDHDYALHADAGPSDIREQNVDGSDYTEQTARNPARNVVGSREAANESSVEFGAPLEEEQREITMEGENLQDLSIISGTEMTFSREQMFDVVSGNITDIGKDRGHDVSDTVEYPADGSRRQSANRTNRTNTSGEDSEPDRTFKSSPRRDRDKHKASRDRERDRDKDGRYSRGDRKYERDPDRRSGRDARRSDKDRRDRDRRDRDRDISPDSRRRNRDRDRDVSPDSRRHRRSARSRRYETEDTDCCSDRERERRRYREGSYTSKPPRAEEKERRRYATAERDDRDDRDHRYGEAGGGRRRGDRPRDRYERRYRDIDPTRKYGNLRREEEERRRGENYSSGSRAGSREATATDDDAPESERRRRDRERRARTDRTDRADRADHDPYYLAGYGSSYGDPFLLQRQQYSYYERLRRTDPAAYMRLYKQLLSAPHKMYAEGYGSLAYDARADDRGSLHSGRSSANGLKATDTDLNTDASLNLHLEESTVRSERMTPFKFSTAHIKGSMSARHLVLVPAAYPVDGRPATVQLVPLAAAAPHHPHRHELLAYPGPLVRRVTHKTSVIEYCRARASGVGAGAGAAHDPVGYVLLWELLALMLRQNGVVVGTDIAELLMRNARDHRHRDTQYENRGDSPASAEVQGAAPGAERGPTPVLTLPPAESTALNEESSLQSQPVVEAVALDRLRELLIYGNRQDALEWAMNNKLWGHALQLAAHSDRRIRAGVATRFLASVPRADPLHTLYATLAARLPPAATCVAEERWGDWRPHAAIMLSNGGGRPEHERRALTQLGDSLASRGLAYSAQFCYLSGGVQFARHPLAPLQVPPAPSTPPRLSLLLADPRAATLSQLATNQAIFATEIYEYAVSLSQEDYVIEELQVYKLMAACRLLDIGECERALAYAERAARAVTSAPRSYPPALPARLAHLADRLKYYDPALQEDPPLVDEPEPDSAEPSPRHHQQWLDDVKNVANMLEAEMWQRSALQQQQQPVYPEQTMQYQQPEQAHREHEESPDYAAQYYQGQQEQFAHAQFVQQDTQYAQNDAQYTPHELPQSDDRPGDQQQGLREAESSYAYREEWPRTEEKAHTYADPYWQSDPHYGYGEESAAGAGGAAQGAGGLDVPPPSITLPGSAPTKPAAYDAYDEDRPDSVDNNGTERDVDAAKDIKKQDAKGNADRSKERARGSGADAGGGGGGWLGGILNKLSLRTPNQMILPDDKNPTIVWDAEHKRWRNLESDGEEAPRPPPPPPATHLAHLAPAQGPAGAGGVPAGAAPVSNIFKMQKGRHIKKSYVDVFNPSGAATRPLPPAAEVLGAPQPAGAAPAYFVPTPSTAQGGFYDPTQMGGGEEHRSGI